MKRGTSISEKAEPKAVNLWFVKGLLCVELQDGRQISAPLEWFPRLNNATHAQRQNWRLIGDGIGIHWSEIDEDISIQNLLT